MDPTPLTELIADADGRAAALLGLGIPRCPASELLAASLPAIADTRPGLRVGYALLNGLRLISTGNSVPSARRPCKFRSVPIGRNCGLAAKMWRSRSDSSIGGGGAEKVGDQET